MQIILLDTHCSLMLSSKFRERKCTRGGLTGRCWHSPETPPQASRRAGWSVCSTKSHSPPRPPARSCRRPRSRSCRGGRSGTSAPPAGSGRTADRGASRTTAVEPAAPAEWTTSLLPPLQRTSPGSPTSAPDLVPTETTGSRRCATETELRRRARSSLCSPAASSPLCPLSVLTCCQSYRSSVTKVSLFF